MKEDFQADEEGEQDDLQQKRCTDQAIADSDLFGAAGEVCYLRCAIACQDLDNDIESHKGADDPARVDHGEVRDVVERASEKHIIGQGIYGSIFWTLAGPRL